MIDTFSSESLMEFSEEKLEPRRVPQASGELGNRWKQLFHLKSIDQPKEVSQEEMLGLVETVRDYWLEVESDPKLLQPYWPKHKADGEAEWWGRAAECLRDGEGDIRAIDHVGEFIIEKVRQQLEKNPNLDVKKRLGEVVSFLKFFKSSPKALPSWQKVEHGLPAIDYPKVLV